MNQSGTYREVIYLAYPVVFSMLARTFMGLVDTFFMGWVGTTAQAGVGLGAMVSWSYSSFFMGTLTVVTTFTAQHYGAKNFKRCGEMAWHSMVVVAVFSILILFLASHVRSFIDFLGVPAPVSKVASDYAYIRILGLPLVCLDMAITSFMRGIEDTKTPMKVSLFAMLLNFPLNYWFIFGGWGLPAYGPKGAAYATVISIGAGVTLLVWFFLRAAVRCKYNTGFPRQIHWSVIRDQLKVGLPIGTSWVLETITWTVFTVFMARFGEVSLAAHNIVMQVIHLSFMPGVAASVAATTLVGKCIGARDLEGAKRSGNAALTIAMFFMGFMGAIFMGFGWAIARVFSSDKVVVALARQLFYFAAVFQVFDAMGMVSSGILRGAGDTRWPMVISLIYAWFFFLPLIWFLGFLMGWGVFGAWGAATLYIICLGITLYFGVRSGRWRNFSVV